MTNVLSLGAINKLTGEYVYPKIANKKDEYICYECNKSLILCKGDIRAHHFRHKVDSINPCHHYSNPTETQIHKHAKILMKYLLERKIQISFIRTCCCCKKKEEFEIPEISKTSNIQVEYRFEYNGVKIADVAYVDVGDFLCIFEICNTHKTCSENRPEPWFEIDAKTLIKMANDNRLTSLQIPCIRCEKCDDCIESEEKRIKIKNLEDQKKYLNKCIEDQKKYLNECSINEEQVLKFPDKSTRRRCTKTIKEYKGKIKIIDKELDILMGINTKQEKLDRLEQEYRGNFFFLEKTPEYRFIKNDVDFTLSNGIFDIIHPLTKQKIKLSNRNKNKVFINGKWREYKCWNDKQLYLITLDIINWYYDKPIIRAEFENDLTFTSNQPIIENKADDEYECEKSEDCIVYLNCGSCIHYGIPCLNCGGCIETEDKKQEIINNGDTLKYALTAKNKTERRNYLSKYLQSNELGELNNLDMSSFIQIYDKFFDNNNKINIDDIQKVTIERRGDYNSKCFNFLVDNNKHVISIKRFN
jgi:hypothetical protein